MPFVLGMIVLTIVTSPHMPEPLGAAIGLAVAVSGCLWGVWTD